LDSQDKTHLFRGIPLKWDLKVPSCPRFPSPSTDRGAFLCRPRGKGPLFRLFLKRCGDLALILRREGTFLTSQNPGEKGLSDVPKPREKGISRGKGKRKIKSVLGRRDRLVRDHQSVHTFRPSFLILCCMFCSRSLSLSPSLFLGSPFVGGRKKKEEMILSPRAKNDRLQRPLCSPSHSRPRSLVASSF